jgi:hypothetical protein
MFKYYIAQAKNGFKFYCFSSNVEQAKEKQLSLISEYKDLQIIELI